MEAFKRLVAVFLLIVTSGALGITWWMSKSMKAAESAPQNADQAKLIATADAMQTYLIPVFGALTLLAVFYAFITFLKQRVED